MVLERLGLKAGSWFKRLNEALCLAVFVVLN